MATRISVGNARAQLSALMTKVAHGGETYVIERRGKPLAALVNVDDLQQIERQRATGGRPLGALALVGAWRGLMDADEIDEMVADIYAQRDRDVSRPAELKE